MIIPTYNCGHLICDAVESVLKQSFINYEIIVVDDGSNDNTRVKLFDYISAKLVTYIFQENKGLPSARNTGINLAKGEYIFCLDADDEMLSSTLAELFESAQKNKSGWVISDLIRIEGDQIEIQKAKLPGEDKLMDMLRKKCYFQARFYRKDVLDVLGGYDDQQRFYEDWDLYIRLMENGIKFSYVPQALYLYKIRRQSITKQRNLKKKLFFIERIYHKHYRRLADNGDSEVVNLYAEHMWRLASDYFYKCHSIVATFRCLIQSYKYDPLIIKKYLHTFKSLKCKL